MAVNYLSPAFVKLNYSFGTHTHTMTIPTKPSGTPIPGTSPNLLAHNGGSVAFGAGVDALSAVLVPLMGSAMTLDTADFWSQPTPEDDPVWIYSHSLDDDGTSAGSAITAQQQVFTFRTDLGGLYRFYIMEGAVLANLALSYAAMGADSKALADYILGATSWLYGRDGGEPLVSLGYKTKYNDVLRRRWVTG